MILCICRRQKCLRTWVCVIWSQSLAHGFCLSYYYCFSFFVFSFVGRWRWQNMLEGHGLQRMLLEQELLITAAVLLGLWWLREKKEAHNGICRECAHFCTKMGAPFYSKIKKSCRLCCQGTMHTATHGGCLPDLEPGLVWSLPAGKCRQS